MAFIGTEMLTTFQYSSVCNGIRRLNVHSSQFAQMYTTTSDEFIEGDEMPRGTVRDTYQPKLGSYTGANQDGPEATGSPLLQMNSLEETLQIGTLKEQKNRMAK